LSTRVLFSKKQLNNCRQEPSESNKYYFQQYFSKSITDVFEKHSFSFQDIIIINQFQF
jgi:hypothetical protein